MRELALHANEVNCDIRQIWDLHETLMIPIARQPANQFKIFSINAFSINFQFNNKNCFGSQS